MRLPDLCRVLADKTGQSPGRYLSLARPLQHAGLIPKSEGGSNSPDIGVKHAVLLLFAHASGAQHADVADSVEAMAGYEHAWDDGQPAKAGEYITWLLNCLVSRQTSDFAKLSYASAISVISGDRPAVAVRVTCDDQPLEIAFTPDAARWKPHLGTEIATTVTIPGKVLFDIAMDIAGLIGQPIEYRTVPATWTVKT